MLQAGSAGLPGVDVSVIAVSSGASDNYDGADRLSAYVNPTINLKIYHSATAGWLGPEGFYEQDFRAPIWTEKTWEDIYLWWTPGTTYFNWPLYLYPFHGMPPPVSYRFTLYLDQVPAGVTYNGNWMWAIPSTGLEIPWGTFAPFASETGLDGYRFHLTVVVSEPGSLLALAGGLALVAAKRARRARG